MKAAKLFSSHTRALRGLGRDAEANRYDTRDKGIESHIAKARDHLKKADG